MYVAILGYSQIWQHLTAKIQSFGNSVCHGLRFLYLGFNFPDLLFILFFDLPVLLLLNFFIQHELAGVSKPLPTFFNFSLKGTIFCFLFDLPVGISIIIERNISHCSGGCFFPLAILSQFSPLSTLPFPGFAVPVALQYNYSTKNWNYVYRDPFIKAIVYSLHGIYPGLYFRELLCQQDPDKDHQSGGRQCLYVSRQELEIYRQRAY